MTKHSVCPLLIPLALLCTALPAFGAAETLPCADRSVTASAVHTPEDVKSFVQCAYEFVQEMGFEEARRAFNEDERWKSVKGGGKLDRWGGAKLDRSWAEGQFLSAFSWGGWNGAWGRP